MFKLYQRQNFRNYSETPSIRSQTGMKVWPYHQGGCINTHDWSKLIDISTDHDITIELLNESFNKDLECRYNLKKLKLRSVHTILKKER